MAPSVCRMTFPILASLLVRLVVLLPFQLLRLSLATPSRWTPLALSVFLHCVVALRSEERFSRNAETDLVCRLLLEKKNNKKKLDSTPSFVVSIFLLMLRRPSTSTLFPYTTLFRSSVCRMTFPILASLLVRLVVLLPFQLLRLSLATPSRWTPLALSVFLHCVVALLLTLL